MPGSTGKHVIRLRDPWEHERVPPAGNDPEPAPPIRFHRRFGLPTGLAPEDQIELVIDRIGACGRVWLNGTLLGGIQPGPDVVRFSLQGCLQPRNLLTLEFEEAADEELVFGRLVGEVRLEIVES